MSVNVPETVASAYTTDHLVQLVEANEYGPTITEPMADRLIDLATRRTQARGTDATHVGERDFLVMTTWDEFCRNTFGGDDVKEHNVPNRFALCVPDFEVSSGREAWLCKEAVAVHQGWLESGDGRRTEMTTIDQSDTQFHDDPGEFWCPKECTGMVGFGDELVYEEPAVADAM